MRTLEIGTLVSLALTYDARDLISTLSGPGGLSSFTHDPGGRLTGIETPEGSTRSFTDDTCGRLSEVENQTDSGIQTFAYTHDANGIVTSENQATYSYDVLDRLTSWYDPGTNVTTTYTYDAAGNLVEVKEDGLPTESYTYNAGDQITSSGYAYDLNGNLTADPTHPYLYDAENQLVEVISGQTTVCTMTYDSGGRRTSLSTASGTTYFHWAGSVLVAESDASGALLATYAYGPAGAPASMTRAGQTYYYQTSAHGDVVSLTDSSGTIVNTYAYDPWGAPLTVSETVPNPFRYAGYYYDSETGLGVD